MDDRFEKYFEVEKNILRNTEAQLKIFDEIDDKLDELYQKRRKASEEEKRQINKQIEEQVKKREEAEKTLNDQAIKRIFSIQNLNLNNLEKLHAERIKFEKEYDDAVRDSLKAQTKEEQKAASEKLKSAKKDLDIHLKKEEIAKKDAEYEEKRIKLITKAQTLREVGDKKAAKLAEAERKKLTISEYKDTVNRQLEEGTISKAEYKQAQRDIKNMELQAKNAEMFANLGDTIEKGLKDAINKGLNQVNVAIEDVTKYRTGIMARLQGIGGGEYDYSSMLGTVSKNLAASPYIQTKKYMENLDKAVEKGIAYNVEQRAFLNTVKDSIATTFDAFDSNLMRLIRLQQADSTAARLGMEAALTKTLNSVFSDTSYLSDMYDNITAAIVESEATMSRNQATEFEYVVQKWMGALYSLGASQSMINQIAQGINYLGTGNVQALSSNTPLQTLFAMSASRAEGLDYAQMLVEGLDASNTNKLLKSMVEYLREIAVDNKNNNVVKAAYGDLYQMSLADMKAITSLSSEDITSIYSQTMSYGEMNKELENQFSNISKRLSTGEMINNILDNFVYNIGSSIAQDAVTYTIWQVTDLIQNATGGLHIPAISVFGNMVDLSSFTLEGIMKTGIVGLSTLGQIGNILSSLKSGGLDLNMWNSQDTLTRGQIEEITNGSVTTTSGSTYVGSSSSSDIKKSSIAGAVEESADVEEITGEKNKAEYTFDDFYKAVYEDHDPLPVYLDNTFGLGKILYELVEALSKSDRIENVNIKSSDVKLNVSISDIESKLRESIKNYIKTNYAEILANEMRESLIGSSKSSATIAKVCDKIINDNVDVVIKNNGVDTLLDRFGTFGLFV